MVEGEDDKRTLGVGVWYQVIAFKDNTGIEGKGGNLRGWHRGQNSTSISLGGSVTALLVWLGAFESVGWWWDMKCCCCLRKGRCGRDIRAVRELRASSLHVVGPASGLGLGSVWWCPSQPADGSGGASLARWSRSRGAFSCDGAPIVGAGAAGGLV